ncbi:MAG: chemotaxis protein CheD [Pseudomonadales bacterium]
MMSINRQSEVEEIPVHIGDIALGCDGQKLSAILGSCVSVVLVDTDQARFTMSHSLLPEQTDQSDTPSARWVDQAVILGLELLDVPTNRYRRLQAYVAGGACMMEMSGDDPLRVGDLNVAVALASLQQYRIPVISQHVGGTNGRRIVYCGESQSCQISTIPRSVWA